MMPQMSSYAILLTCLWSIRIGECADCGRLTFSGQSGSIRSPSFPARYPTNLKCVYSVTAQPNSKVFIQFRYFELERRTHRGECPHDFLEIGGTKYCGATKPPAYTSTDRFLNFTFSSDASITQRGWHLTYESVCATDKSGGTCTDTPGIIQSDGYPLPHSSNIESNSTISVPTGKVAVKFVDFDLEHHSSCQYDYFRFLTGTPWQTKSCGRALPPPVLADGSVLTFEFKSDHSLQEKGWKLKYDSCGGTYTGSSGTVNSPFYPSHYTNKLDCTYNITTPEGTVAIVFLAFDTEGNLSVNDCHDYVKVRDPTNGSVLRVCGDQIPGVVNVSGSTALIEFHTDYSVNKTGWQFSFGTNGGWSNWSQWGDCSKTCNNGTRHRNRSCNKPAPVGVGITCAGDAVETVPCNERKVCNSTGHWSQWVKWSSCSVSCGIGTRHRTRQCSIPLSQGGGMQCEGNDTEIGKCSKDCRVRNGEWSTWGSWSECNETCGGGFTIRNRTCTIQPPVVSGSSCNGSDMNTRSCNTHACPVNSSWSTWGSWSSCNKSGSARDQVRVRSCLNPLASLNGSDCIGTVSMSRSCQPCSEYSSWGLWSPCSRSCSRGIQTRNRFCLNGTVGLGQITATRDCNVKQCPVNGQWSNWSEWQPCSHLCGLGQQHRRRNCDNPKPAHGGENCSGNATESRHCGHGCPTDGQWSLWTEWDKCSVSCGTGYKTRNRRCNNPIPAIGGRVCSGNPIENHTCNAAACPVNGQWAEWSLWAACSVTCGSGKRQRVRTCSQPAPKYNGNPCIGTVRESQDCFSVGCGVWTRWTHWSLCSDVCKVGVKTRRRQCNSGSSCKGSSYDERPCNGSSVCPMWSNWSEWSNCSLKYDQIRYRNCTHGGVFACNSEESQMCNMTTESPKIVGTVPPCTDHGKHKAKAVTKKDSPTVNYKYVVIPLVVLVVVVLSVSLGAFLYRKRGRRHSDDYNTPLISSDDTAYEMSSADKSDI